jgi:hypothetical protein
MKIKLSSLVVLLGLLLSFSLSYAQTPPAEKDTSWKIGGFVSFNANQVTLQNWAAGGDNAVSLIGLLNAFANFKNEHTSWENSLDLGYGLIANGKQIKDLDAKSFRKNEDRIELNSKYGRKAIGNFFYSGMVNFRTQFAPGYADFEQNIMNSNFMAPGYLTIALGMDWKPVKYFSFFLSPATGKYTFVLDDSLANAGAFGVDQAVYDANGFLITPGRQFRPEFGASMVVKFQKDIMKNVNLKTNLSLFNNFTDKNTANRKNIDVNWDAALNLKVNKFISASIITQLIYDHDILIKLPDGLQGRRTQWKQILGVGFSYKW